MAESHGNPQGSSTCWSWVGPRWQPQALPAPRRAGAFADRCGFCLLLSPDILGLCISGLTVSLSRFGLLFLDKIFGACAAERCKSCSITVFLFLVGKHFLYKNNQGGRQKVLCMWGGGGSQEAREERGLDCSLIPLYP